MRKNDMGWAWKPNRMIAAGKERPARKMKSRNRRDPFYRSEEWIRLRYAALKMYGARCQCCNRTGQVMHVDHIKPRSRYPELALDIFNLQVLCAMCNYGKGTWDSTDWRGHLTKEQLNHMAQIQMESP